MNYRELKGLDRRIDDLSVRIDEALKSEAPSATESAADLSKYLCILISGHLEKHFSYLVGLYCTRSSREVQRYIGLDFKFMTNLRMKKVLEILNRFNTTWEETFKTCDDFEVFQDSLEYIVNNRNKISHGENTSLSKRELIFHREVLRRFLKHLEKFFGAFG